MDNRQYGQYYGYPTCCIDEFVGFQKDGVIQPARFRPKEQQKAQKNGFIPCVKHAKEILQGKIHIEDLILKTRQEPKPFLRMTKQEKIRVLKSNTS